MTIRLNKVTRDLNVGIATVVEFLQKKGYTVEANPNTKISEEQYAILVKEFSTDKNLRLESERFIQERQNKDRNKASVSIEGFEKQPEKPKSEDVIKTVVPEDARPKFKPVGKIDLDKLNGRRTEKVEKEPEQKKETVEERPVAQPEVKKEPEVKVEEVVAPVQAEPVAKQVEPVKQAEPVKQPEAVKPEPVKEPEPIVEKQPAEVEKVVEEVIKEEPKVEVAPVKAEEHNSMEQPVKAVSAEIAPETTVEVEKETSKEEEIFKIRQPELGAKINVIGQIDLAALNQSTRPKKKSKEEKRREREEKEKIRQDQKKLMKEAIIKEIRKDDSKLQKGGVKDNVDAAGNKKKRNRINKEKVDVNNVATSGFAAPRPNVQGKGGNNGGGNNQGGNNNRKNNNKDRFKKPVIKQEVSEEDVAKQVKETLARLTTKGKNKTSKYRKEKREMASNRMQELEDQEMADSKVLKLTEFVTANELATMMDVSVNQVIATCMSIGIMVSINQRLDAETINLVAEEFGFKTEYVSAEVAQAIVEEEDAPEDLQPRAPIVTVMGHVDHGKTSLLDYIRKANVIAGEAGGITQHIGAYHVETPRGIITFLDTPGHEAFTAMRARGAQVTDIVILVVAADDGVMPQTKEAIAHAKAGNVPLVVAINKIDKPEANPQKVKQELMEHGLVSIEWGGDTEFVEVSAKKQLNLDTLLDTILITAEILELKANPKKRAKGVVLESKLDPKVGPIADILVQEGTLKIGDVIVAGEVYGKVRALINDRGERVEKVELSQPAEIIGFNQVPQAGDTMYVIQNEQHAKRIVEEVAKERKLSETSKKTISLESLSEQFDHENLKELNLVLRADSRGSVEALRESLMKLSTNEVAVNIIQAASGAITESDVKLAEVSNAIIIGFHVRPTTKAIKEADLNGVEIRTSNIIYHITEDIEKALTGMLEPEFKEIYLGRIEIKKVFKVSKVGNIAGCVVVDGKVKNDSNIRILRDGIVMYEGKLSSLKRYKDDAKEVVAGQECGLGVENFNDIKEGDIVEAFEIQEIKRTLK